MSMAAAVLPKLAYVYAPMLALVQAQHWPAAPTPEVMAAQVEKETCITLRHSRCWSPRAELKTSRENGVGLGQITRAYNRDGSVRFDKQAELRERYGALSGWTWKQRYDPRLQLTGLVLMDYSGHRRYSRLAATPGDAWAMTLSGYNGGDGAVMKDILLCRKARGCDPGRWFGNVEVHSTKSRAKWHGYGQSAYEINRGYVRRILNRAPAYRTFWSRDGRM